jgi:hypothetical protein
MAVERCGKRWMGEAEGKPEQYQGVLRKSIISMGCRESFPKGLL